MTITRTATLTGLFAIGLFAMTGCGKSQPTGTTSEKSAGATHEHEHEHGAEGPHGGHIIELGTEDYHAELTHDETAHRVGIYLLGGDAKTAAPIEATSVIINVTADGKLTQHTLPAVAQPDDAAGKSSYFEIVDESLCAVVCGESESPANARVSITIDGKPYVGMIETTPHEHDHDHGHEH